jgi:hypothetical protein
VANRPLAHALGLSPASRGQALFRSQGPFFLGDPPPTRFPAFVGFTSKSLFMSTISARNPVALIRWPAKEFKLEIVLGRQKIAKKRIAAEHLELDVS